MPQQIHQSNLATIDEGFTTKGALAIARPITAILYDETHLQMTRVIRSLDIGHNSPNHDRLIGHHRVPVDELGILTGMRRTRSSQEVDGFQEVGLALGIIAMKKNNALRQVQFQSGVITKIGQRQTSHLHGLKDRANRADWQTPATSAVNLR